MNIDLHILCYNEADIIRLVLRHYKKFCRNMYVYDNYSTDNSREIAEQEGAIVSLFGDKWFDDENNRQQKNKCWVGSDADYVICCDMDEVLFSHKWLNAYGKLPDQEGFKFKAISDYEKASIFNTIGWQVMSDEMPKDDLLEVTNGFRFDNYSKNIIFSPKQITEINFNPGSHRIDPKGIVTYSDFTFHVLHYKHIGGVQRTIDRYKEYQPRMSKLNRRKGWGSHYSRTEQSIREEWNERMAKSKPLI